MSKDIHEAVRERYAGLATRAAKSSTCCGSPDQSLTAGFYANDEKAALPVEAVAASAGCANPTALAELRPGETVLDFGSGGGIDVLLAARRVGPQGFVYGVDMTDEMLELAERNRQRAGADNVRFIKGKIESVPLPDASVDVIISNCVINLAPDKDRVLQEAYRVLRPGGRFAVADIATLGPVPAAIRRSVEAWVGCVAGALSVEEYLEKMNAAGFENADVEIVKTYGRADVDAVASDAGLTELIESLDEADLAAAEGRFASVFVRGRKPAHEDVRLAARRSAASPSRGR